MKLVLKEAYRMVRVKEGDRVLSIPALAAVVRSLIASAAKGNGPAQRLVFPLVQQAEQTCVVQPQTKDKSNARQVIRAGHRAARRPDPCGGRAT